MLLFSKQRIYFCLTILLVFSLINSCKSTTNTAVELEDNKSKPNCPVAPQDLPLIRIDRQEYRFYNAFNYQIQDIVADADAIAFKSDRHNFTLCRANNKWIIEEIADANPLDSSELEAKTIRVGETNYQFAVKLNRDFSKAIFELIIPESTQAKQQTLYDLEQTKRAGAGVELGEPIISQPVVYGDRFFWSVFAYRGEGFGGIATIVSYNPTTDEISVIQPPEIADQIINNFAIAGKPNKPTFLIATQLTGEGNPYLPSMGLVTYHPESQDYTKGKIDSYRVDNSPLVGAIPTKLHVEKDILWIGTGNGICHVRWQTIANNDSWDCWRFALKSKLPNQELPVYRSLLDDNPDATIKPNNEDTTIEVLWWMPQQREPLQGRFEIKYEPAITELTDTGATTWDEYYYDDIKPPVGHPPLHWAGNNWHWEENKFIRGFDEVSLDLVGSGARGISSGQPNDDYIFDAQAIRGDLELLELTRDSTKIKYYSAWVEDSLLKPYLTIAPQEKSFGSQPNPLLEIKSQLK